MFTVRCTARALKRFRFQPAAASSPSTTRLGSWYANLLNFRRQRLVICVSERTLLPVLVPALNDTFPVRLGEYVGQVLVRLGIPRDLIEAEIAQMGSWEIGRTQSRSVIGVMTEFSFALATLSPLEVSLWLGDTPTSPLNGSDPISRTCEAFDVPPPPHPRRSSSI